ncbi:MAG: caspase family protein [Elusimicrobiota bacterium]
MKPRTTLPICMVFFAQVFAGCFAPKQNTGQLIKQIQAAAVTTNADSPYKDLTVGVVQSKNTIKNMARSRAKWNASHFTVILKTEMEGYWTILKRNFKSVTDIDSLEDLGNSPVDVIALLDVYAKPPPGAFGSVKVDAGMTMFVPGGRELDVFRGKKQRSQNEGISLHDTDGQQRNMRRTFKETQQQLETALLASQKLQEFARARGGSGGTTTPAAEPRAYNSDVDLPAYEQNENSANYAMVVGVEDYDNLPRADFAERDARAVREHLLALGYPSQNLIYLTGRKATRTNITKFLESWLPQNVTEQSQVFFYFSGHGAPDIASKSAYLVPWDGDPSFLEQTAYPIRKLYKQLNALKAKQVVVAMDACFSGQGGRSVLVKGARPLVLKVDTGLSSVKGKLVALAAAGDEEITGTEKSQGHGLFTYYLLRGLNEMRGKITVNALHEYLQPRVHQAARRENREQNPRLVSSEEFKEPIRLR